MLLRLSTAIAAFDIAVSILNGVDGTMLPPRTRVPTMFRGERIFDEKIFLGEKAAKSLVRGVGFGVALRGVARSINPAKAAWRVRSSRSLASFARIAARASRFSFRGDDSVVVAVVVVISDS